MTDIKANPLFDQFGPYESETLARQIGKQIAERGHDVAVWNVSDEFWFVSNKPDEVSPFHSGTNRYPGFVIPAIHITDKGSEILQRLRQPKRNPHGKATTLKAIVKYLNGLSRKQIKEFAKQDSVPMNRRLSLMVFIRDWRVDDPTHEEYLRGVAEGHSTDEALQAGDLLNFLMVGGKELQLYKGDDFVPTTRWTEYLGPFLEKVPATRGVEDLIGVHDAVLGMLPMKTYNHYTIAEVFADHPDLKTAMLGEPVLLAPIEFKALASLQNIVDSGSIGQFKLALSKGSNKGIAKLAEARGGDIGGIVLSAFKLAQAAVAAFKTGDYRTAKELMDDLQRQYGIGAGSFASVEEYMFIATLSAPRAFTENPNSGKFGFKGNPRQVLLALDTTFNTDANDQATPARRAMAARIVAQQNAWKYNGKKVEAGATYNNYGTNGYRNFIVNHKKGGSGSGRKDTQTVSIMSTDWLAIFYAIANAEKIVSNALKPLTMTTIENVFNEVFTIGSFGIEGFEAGTSSSKSQIDKNKIINYFQDKLKEGEKWKDYLIGNKNARAKDRKWDFDKLMKDYPKATHPDIYQKGKGGSDITRFQGNEPMYRFLVYSDLQNPNQSLLGNFNPKGTLTVILRAAQDGEGEKDWLPFEADMFYESYYSGDALDKLLPSVSQDGKPDEEINLNDLSLSGRARRSGLNKKRATIEAPLMVSRRPMTCANGHKFTLDKAEKKRILGVVPATGAITHNLYCPVCGEKAMIDPSRPIPRAGENPPSDTIVPIYAGEPKGVKENLGAIFSEIVIGRNVVKDVGEVVQSIYRGLVGGRTSMAEKRMAMAVASMQKELSDRAIEAGGNAVANLKMDYEMIDGSATLTVMAHADAIVLPQARKARKKSSSKKPSSGNMISIELTPRTQVQLSTAVDKADWFKAAMKDDKSGKLKELWNEYAKGDNPGIITERGIVRGWKWRGKNYMFSKDELKGGKSTNKQRRKKFPASLEKAIAKDGTYADYKKGQTNMRMIYAKRIDNGRLVPFRINIPKILLRKRADKVVPKAGGKKSHVQMLLDLIEKNFGTITLDKQFVSSGGYDTYKKDPETGDFLTDKKGKKSLKVPVDRGIHLLYKAQGLDTEGAYSTNAFPAYTRGGKIVYRAMSFDGKPVDMEVAG